MLALSILGGEINGLRSGGVIKVYQNNADELFEESMLLKQDLQDNAEIGIILGFSDCYKEKLTEDDLKK